MGVLSSSVHSAIAAIHPRTMHGEESLLLPGDCIIYISAISFYFYFLLLI